MKKLNRGILSSKQFFAGDFFRGGVLSFGGFYPRGIFSGHGDQCMQTGFVCLSQNSKALCDW